jgi:hypothetical protein
LFCDPRVQAAVTDEHEMFQNLLAQPTPRLLCLIVNTSVVLLTPLDFDNIVRFVLLEGWLVNFFVLQILPTNIAIFSPIGLTINR